MKAFALFVGLFLILANDLQAQTAGHDSDIAKLALQLETASTENPGNPDVLNKIDAFGLQAMRSGDTLAQMYYYRLKSHHYHGFQRHREALNSALLGLALNPRLDVQLHFQLILDVVSNYWNLGEYSSAIPYLIRGENLLNDPGIKSFPKAILYNFMGQYHYNEYASQKALDFFILADSLLNLAPTFREIEFIWQQNLKSNKGLALLDLKRYAEAERLFEQAFSISKSIDNKTGMGFALVNKVICSRNRFPDSSFSTVLREALVLVEFDSDVSLRNNVLRELAKDYFIHGQTDSLRSVLPKLETSVNFIPNNSTKVKLLFLLAQFNRKIDSEKAMRFFDSALALNDSILLNPSGQHLLQIERERNLNLKEQDAKQLAEVKAEQLRKTIRLTSFFLFTAICFLVLLVGLLVALLQKDRRLRKTLKNLRWQISNSYTLNQQLQLSMQQKNMLLGAVAHDLRNLLVNVNQVSELMVNKELDNAPEFKDRMVKLMERSSRLGMHTIEDLIEGVQPEGRHKLKLDEVNPSDCLDFVTDLLSFKAEKKSITIQLQKEEYAPSILADRDKLNRALINLLDNAIKFSPIDSTVHLSYESNADFLIFTIKDFGRGLHRAQYSEGQNPFTDEGQSGTLGEPSTGFGLFIVRTIAELHRGSFRLTSTDHEGTRAELSIFRHLN